MKKNVEVIDDGTIDDMVTPVESVIPKNPEDVIKEPVPIVDVPVAPETIPTAPIEEILPKKEEIKNPLEELEKQKDSIPPPMEAPEVILTPEEKEVLNDWPMVSGEKIINMLRIILLWSKQHVYICRMWFESAVEFDSWHSITFMPDENKMVIERWGEVQEYEATKFYSMKDIQDFILEPYLFSLQHTYAR